MTAGDRPNEGPGLSDRQAGEPEIRYPFAKPSGRIRGAVAVGVGRAAAALRPRYVERLLRDGDPMTFTRLERLMLVGWVSRARAEDWPLLSGVHERFWAGRGGALFSASPEVEARFEHYFISKHARSLEFLERELGGRPGERPVFCEIGCGNGLALEYASRRITSIPRFVGIDINTAAIEQNSARWRAEPRLEFVSADAVDWIEQQGGPGWTYFSNAGVLEYFPPEKVNRLYRATADFGGPALWILTEPVYAGYDLATETESRPNGFEFSFCHNHAHLLRLAGWEVVEQFESEVDGLRFVTVCARLAGEDFDS